MIRYRGSGICGERVNKNEEEDDKRVSRKILTWIGGGDSSSATKIATCWHRILLVVTVKSIRSMILKRGWFITA